VGIDARDIIKKIQQGDTLSDIAQRHKTTVDAIAGANGIKDINKIYAGHKIKIPGVPPAIPTTGSNNSKLAEKLSVTGSGKEVTPSWRTYRESGAVGDARRDKVSAENALANLGDYAYAGQDKLNDWMAQYESRPDFSYDFNGDALYQQYKDKYIQQGKMAMADTIGQASAMTGGYGNSYAATVGNQAYQSHLQQLNDVIPELAQMAYDRYNQKGQDMLNMISLLRGERDFDYGTWTDKKNSLLADRDYYGSQFNQERTWDYSKFDSNRNFNYQEDRDAVADEQWNKTFNEGKRQFNEQMAFNKQQYDDSKKINLVGGYKVDDKGNVIPSNDYDDTDEIIATIPRSVVDHIASLKSNAAREKFLASLSETLTEDQISALGYKYDNPIKDYSKRTWDVRSNGGFNWWGGVDNDAEVTDQYGNHYSLEKLVDLLVKEEDMTKSQAEKYVLQLQKDLKL
jgi:hypothetical protein